MSIAGRKPKPTQLKKLQGNPGKRKLNDQEPKPSTPVKRPRGLERKRRKFWDDLAPELEQLGILTGIDVPAFRLLVEAYSLALEAAAEVAAEGFTVLGRDGPKKHPAAQVWRDNAALYKSLAAEFGLTPSSRTRLKIEPDAKQLSLTEQLEQLFQVNHDGD